jgi:hypothetical protein
VGVSTLAPATVEERELQFSHAQPRKRKLGFASPADLAYAINYGAITNAGFSAKDIANAEYIYGASRGRVMGTSTKPSLEENVLPETGEKAALKEQELHCDPFVIDDTWFVLSVVSPMGQWICTDIAIRTAVAYAAVIEKHIGICAEHGFTITRVVVDSERGLACLAGRIPNVPVDVVAPGQHVQKAERAIRTLKERVRAIEASLPYNLPRRCVRHAVAFVVQRVNAVPRRSLGPVATGELFTGRKFDMKEDGKGAFGDYVVAPEPKNDNTMRPRARLCILMHPQGNATPGWLLLDIERGVVIRRSSWRKEPIPPQAIEAINRMADADRAVRDRQLGIAVPEPADLAEQPAVAQEDGADRLPPPAIVRGRAPELEQRPYAVAVEPEGKLIQGPVVVREPEQPAVAVVAQPPQVVDIVRDAEQVFADGHARAPRASARIAGRRVNVCGLHSRFAVTKQTRREHAAVVDRIALHIYAQEAQRTHGDAAVESAEAELREILERKVFTPLSKDDQKWLRKAKKRFVKPFLFYKEKFDKTGRLTNRLVAMDNSPESSLHPDKDSPTVRLESILMVLALAGAEGRRCLSLDVGNAFLEAEMTG